jgi:PDZ domain-containing protein
VFLGRVIVGWLKPEVRILPREALYPDDVSQADVNAANVLAFSDSQSSSIAASMNYLHKPIRTLIVVAAVTEGTPAYNKLNPGDQIVQINGTPIHTLDDVDAAMSKIKPGGTAVVDVIRDSKPTSVSIVTTSNPQDPTRAFLGIDIGESYRAEFPITVNLEGVGGPSGGLMLSLGIVDKLTPGQLNGGKPVAGTGTIDPDGKVGAIGGIAQKMAGARDSGAEFFLAPSENCADVRAAHIPNGLTVAKVSTLSDAVSALEAYVAGKPTVGCS